jgi:segregation and condensation protein A
LSDYRINLDNFAGPLDLLLYLVRKEEVDIYDIPITTITEEYLRYVEMLKILDIELAGEFLVMAATLLHIKSAMLLPKVDDEQMLEDETDDPRAELIRQLLEYKKFKDAANLLNAAAEEQSERYTRPDVIIEKLKPQTEPELDIEQVSVWDLLEAFDSILKATGGAAFDVSNITDDTPIDLYQIEILDRLQKEGSMTFNRIFEAKNNRILMISLFLALLELVRENLASVEQAAPFSPLYVKALTDEPAEIAVQNAILAVAQEDDEKKTEEKSRQQHQPPIPIEEIPAESSSKKSDLEIVEPLQASQQQLPN